MPYKSEKVKYALHQDNNQNHFKTIYLSVKPHIGEYIQLDPHGKKDIYLIENIIHSYIDDTKAQYVHLFVTKNY